MQRSVKPLITEKVCYKVGLIKVRATQAYCPNCNFNIPVVAESYGPKFCSNCGNPLDWNGIHINKDQFLGYVDEEAVSAETVSRCVLNEYAKEG